MHRLSALFCLLLSLQLRAGNVDPILDGMTPGSITFIGESHKRIESAMLVKDLVTAAIERGQCPILALEIADSEQPAIDRVLNNGASVSDIDIPASIDHLPMRKLIGHLATLKTRSPCFSVVAIDAGLDNPHERDEWMAKRLTSLASDRPILVLIGALHTLKKVDWLVKSGKPSVAERLATRGFRVRSFPQRWIPDQCRAGESRHQRLVDAEKPEALDILNGSLMSLINAKPHKSARGVINGLILWKCGDQPKSET
ncbi:hypothetical protein [Methylomicrobium album]|uniref:Haem-binding uptake Tiki superfamily ChaN domain-containing protein n=1 Tax=Methylomicrobium album BG8 TaxID=686340 RepID=H8GRJ6_METAL|nr:hypothetical protein [Methylomicrobium album]EIC27838.1 hypothetical protein Metal_4007 [Methylomicrobium album BG8]